MDKAIIKFDDTEIQECKFFQNKHPILIKNIDINKIVVSIFIFIYFLCFILVNQILIISLVSKIIKKLDLYAYSFQK